MLCDTLRKIITCRTTDVKSFVGAAKHVNERAHPLISPAVALRGPRFARPPQGDGLSLFALQSLFPHQRELQQQIALDDREIVIRHQRDDGLIGGVAMHRDCLLYTSDAADE